jgi:tripartite-type tricarboxylate transporter receptor subunit TctC
LQLAALPVISGFARALDGYPKKPVRLLVGYAAGGPADAIARLTAQWLSERLGQQVLVENRVGAGSNIAAEAVVRSSPDGYTLLFVTVSNAANATLYENLGFDLIHDMVPVASSPGVLVVNPSFPAKTIPEFIGYAKAHPGKITMASSGPGSAPHLYTELFKMMTAEGQSRKTFSRDTRHGNAASPCSCMVEQSGEHRHQACAISGSPAGTK